MLKKQREQIQTLIDNGKREDAIQYLAACVMQYPDDIIAWEMLAKIVLSPAHKRDCYRRILELNPAHKTANAFFAKQPRSAAENIPTQSRIGRIQGINADPTPDAITKIIGHIDQSPRAQLNETGAALPPELRRPCPHCQASIPKTARRCQWCGKNL